MGKRLIVCEAKERESLKRSSILWLIVFKSVRKVSHFDKIGDSITSHSCIASYIFFLLLTVKLADKAGILFLLW